MIVPVINVQGYTLDVSQGDAIPPGRIIDFRSTTNTMNGTATLRWTAVGNDVSQGNGKYSCNDLHGLLHLKIPHNLLSTEVWNSFEY